MKPIIKLKGQHHVSKLIMLLILVLPTIKLNARQDIIREVQSLVDLRWKKPNPQFKPTQHSFFSDTNTRNIYVAPIEWSGNGFPFSWDSDLRGLNFLVKENSDFSVLKDQQADKEYGGTKIVWKGEVSVLIWVSNKIYSSRVNDWNLIETNDCPGNKNFPFITFAKVFDLPNARTNTLSGLAIIPYPSSLKSITRSKLSIETSSSTKIEGDSFDLNGDGIADVFFYSESLDETTAMNRLYLNINGSWQCRWVQLYEECI
jgi:hypothetical protein